MITANVFDKNNNDNLNKLLDELDTDLDTLIHSYNKNVKQIIIAKDYIILFNDDLLDNVNLETLKIYYFKNKLKEKLSTKDNIKSKKI